eukprot:2937743-Pleurochrysis_carterae.AAC.1
MTVGPAGGGKTAARDMLTRAMTKLDGVNEKYSTVRQWILNPKAITMGQLYGEFDENTHEWTDGILCVLYRSAMNEFAQRHVTDRQWLVFDGPVRACVCRRARARASEKEFVRACACVRARVYVR